MAFPHQANAELLVTVGNAVIQPGATAHLDVTIVSDQPAGEPLSLFGFEFRIETNGPTRLEFVSPQGDFQLSSSSYVFAGDSVTMLVPPVGLVSGAVVPNDTYIGGDATASGNDVFVTPEAKLLVRLNLIALTSLPPQSGDLFTIHLVASPNTFFLDHEFGDLSYQATIGAVQVVPEPSPPAYLLSATLGLAILSLRKLASRRARV